MGQHHGSQHHSEPPQSEAKRPRSEDSAADASSAVKHDQTPLAKSAEMSIVRPVENAPVEPSNTVANPMAPPVIEISPPPPSKTKQPSPASSTTAVPPAVAAASDSPHPHHPPSPTEVTPVMSFHSMPDEAAPARIHPPHTHPPHSHPPLKGTLPPPPSHKPTAHAPGTTTAASAKTFTEKEIQSILAVDPDRVIVVIRDNVYDVTHFVNDHPGGPSVLRRNNGKDVTDAFYSMHGPKAVKRLPEFLMGKFVTTDQLLSPTSANPTTASSSHDLSLESIRRAIKEDANRLILILFGDAYDITAMRNEHPGGLRILLNYNAKECGDVFMRIHGLRAKKMVHQYYMGHVPEAGDMESPLRRMAASENAAKSPSKHMNPRAMSTRILEKEPLNAANTMECFTFSCPKPLRLTPGGHIKLFSNVQRDEWRFYTPFETQVASFKVCIKRYPKGRTSVYLCDRAEGEEVFYEGPFAPSWQLGTDFFVQNTPVNRRHLLLLAGGTGMAPMYSILRHALTTQAASVTLVCSVQTPDDLMLVDELDQLAARHAKPLPGQPHTLRIAVAFTQVSEETASPLEHTALVRWGHRIDENFVRTLDLPPTQAAVLCGPPAFNDTLSAVVMAAGVCTSERIHSL